MITWVICTSFSLGSTVWLAIGVFWRFCYGGMVAAGDKLPRVEGKDMSELQVALDSAALKDGY